MTDPSLEDILGKFPEQYKKLGMILDVLNRVEIDVISTLTAFFTNPSSPNSEKTFIFNDALFDNNIFETFENKKRFLIRIIESVHRVAVERSLEFDKDKWLAVCKSIEKLQSVRNKLAHHMLNFSADGKVGYMQRKTHKVRLHETKTAGINTGTMERVQFDLDEELKQAFQIKKQSHKLVSEFLAETRRIIGE